jgi:hypothetical protein
MKCTDKITNNDLGVVTSLLDKKIAEMQNMQTELIKKNQGVRDWRKELNSYKKVFYFLIHNKNRKAIINA